MAVGTMFTIHKKRMATSHCQNLNMFINVSHSTSLVNQFQKFSERKNTEHTLHFTPPPTCHIVLLIPLQALPEDRKKTRSFETHQIWFNVFIYEAGLSREIHSHGLYAQCSSHCTGAVLAAKLFRG